MSDDMLLEEVSPTESPTEKTSQEETPDEWASLDGRSQDRFKKLAQMKNKALEEKRKLEDELRSLRMQQPVPMPPSQGRDFRDDTERAAYERITQLGIATKDDMQKQVEELQNRLYVDNLHMRMESEVNSKKDLPAYDREEIEDYMRENQIWNPKTAYRELYHDEIVAHEAQKLTSKKKDSPRTAQTRSRIGGTQPWTRESLQERLNRPDGLQWFAQNREKILKMQKDLG